MNMRHITVVILLLILSACQPAGVEAPTVFQSVDVPTPTYTKAMPPAQADTEIATSTPIPAYTITQDVKYATFLHNDADNQFLDIYAPRGEEGSWPVVIFLHGFGASKFSHTSASRQIAEAGAVVFTINWPTWTMSDAAEKNGEGFREIYEVVSCAVRYARAKAPDYGGAPSRVIMVGFSAGANTGGWYALSGGNLEQTWNEFAASNDGSPALQVACIVDADTLAHVDAFIGIGGLYTRAAFLQESNMPLWEIVSPLKQIGRYPELRVRLMSGNRDVDVPVEHSKFLNNLLLDNGYNSEVIVYDGPHYVPIDETVAVILELAGDN